MNEENTRLLYERYPVLYRDHDKSAQETCMCWGFECGDGWFDLIDELSGVIENYNKKHTKNPIIALQVKEKFATLRFYISGGEDNADYKKVLAAMVKAEKKSAKTCESCGKRGKLIDTVWLYTMCDNCYDEHIKSRR